MSYKLLKNSGTNNENSRQTGSNADNQKPKMGVKILCVYVWRTEIL